MLSATRLFVCTTLLIASFAKYGSALSFIHSQLQNSSPFTRDLKMDGSDEPWYRGFLDNITENITEDSQEKSVSNVAGKPEVSFVHILSEIYYRYCRTRITSRVVNSDLKKPQEVSFKVILPETAFVSKFIMEIDGKSYEAYVKDKEGAQQIYSDAQRRGQSAGLVETSARNSQVFVVNITAKANSTVAFNLTYEELLSRKLGRYEQAINILPNQIKEIQDFKVEVYIHESQNITFLRVPNLRNDIEAVEDNFQNIDGVIIERPKANKARILWRPSSKDRRFLQAQNIMGKFVVQYDIAHESPAGELLIRNGYFVHFFSVNNIPPLRKHIVFVLDTSGSMSGVRIRQLKDSMKYILDDLKPEDYFNIITFASDIKVWKIRHQKRGWPIEVTEQNLNHAHRFIQGLQASGGTNIHGSLSDALKITNAAKNTENTIGATEYGKLPPNVESLIIFLTDGEPTVGVREPAEIIEKINKLNNINGTLVPIYSLAFGSGADFPFLKKLSLQNFGFARKIYEAADTELQLKGFYNEISSPLLSNVTFKYTSRSSNYSVGSVTVACFPHFFNGTELAVAGRFLPRNTPIRRQNKKNDKLSASSADYQSIGQQVGKGNLSVVIVEVGGKGRDGPIVYKDDSHLVYETSDVEIIDIVSTTTTPRGTRPPAAEMVDSSDSDYSISKEAGTDNVQTESPIFVPTTTTETTIWTELSAKEDDWFLERLWAYLTIKQLLSRHEAGETMTQTKTSDEFELEAHKSTSDDSISAEFSSSEENVGDRNSSNSNHNVSYKSRALGLSLKYGFVTPLTSLVVVKPNETEVKVMETQEPSVHSAAPMIMVPPILADISRSSSANFRSSKQVGSNHYSSSRYGNLLLLQNRQLPAPIGTSRGFARGMRLESAGYINSLEDTSTSNNMGGSYIRKLEKYPLRGINFNNRGTTDEQNPPAYPAALQRIQWLRNQTTIRFRNSEIVEVATNLSTLIALTGPNTKCVFPGSRTVGVCKHLMECVQDSFINDFTIYENQYFCKLFEGKSSQLGISFATFAGACCPLST